MLKANKIVIEGENLKRFNDLLNEIPHKYGKLFDNIVINCIKSEENKTLEANTEKLNKKA